MLSLNKLGIKQLFLTPLAFLIIEYFQKAKAANSSY